MWPLPHPRVNVSMWTCWLYMFTDMLCSSWCKSERISAWLRLWYWLRSKSCWKCCFLIWMVHVLFCHVQLILLNDDVVVWWVMLFVWCLMNMVGWRRCVCKCWMFLLLARKNTKIRCQVRTIQKEENILPGNNLTHTINMIRQNNHQKWAHGHAWRERTPPQKPASASNAIFREQQTIKSTQHCGIICEVPLNKMARSYECVEQRRGRGCMKLWNGAKIQVEFTSRCPAESAWHRSTRSR